MKKTVIKNQYIFLLIIFISSFILYSNTLSNDFVYDDNYQIKDNFWIRDFRFLPQMFLKDVWNFRSTDWVSNYYRPMMHVIYLISYQIFSLKPWGYHLVNILFHASVSIMVFLTIDKLLKHLKYDRLQGDSRFLSIPFITAMIFVVHPIHSEVVSWISAIPDLSYSLFYLLGFYFYIKFKEGSKISYTISLLCFLFALFCKEPAVTFILIIFTYDFIMKREKNIPQSLELYVPFIMVFLIYLGFRFHALKGFTAYQSHQEMGIYQYIINIFPLFMDYIIKIFAPFNLSVFHVFQPIKQIYEIKGIISILIVLLYVFSLILSYKKDKLFFFGLLFFVIPLLPALYIPGLGENPLAERYIYLPLLGFALCISIVIFRFLDIPKYKFITIIVIISAGLLFSYLTIERNKAWKNDLTLWTDTVKKSPEWKRGIIQLAIAHEKIGDIDKSIELLQKLIKDFPDDYEGYSELGVIFALKGRLDDAIEMYKKAIEKNPKDYYSFFNMGKAFYSKGLKEKALESFNNTLKLNPLMAEAYVNIGTIFGELGQIEKASDNFIKALELKPGLVQAHYNLGNYYQLKGNLDDALKHYKYALKINPDYLKARVNLAKILILRSSLNEANEHLNMIIKNDPKDIDIRYSLGEIFYSLGQFDQAIKEFNYVLLNQPENIQALFSLGNLYYRKRMLDESILKYKEVIKYKPDHIDAHFNLGVVYNEKSMYDKAIEEYLKAIKINQQHAGAYENLGTTYALSGNIDKAIYHFKKALELEPGNEMFRNNLYRAYLLKKKK